MEDYIYNNNNNDDDNHDDHDHDHDHDHNKSSSNEIEMFESLLNSNNKNKNKNNNNNNDNDNKNNKFKINSNKGIGFSGHPSPEEKSNIFSKLTFSWANEFVIHCYKNVLQLEHIWNLASYDTSEHLAEKIKKSWEIEITKEKPSYIRAAFRAFGKFYMLSLIFYGISLISQFIGPVILVKMVNLVNDDNSHATYMGYIYPFILTFSLIIGSICSYQSNMISVRTGNHLKTVIQLDIYKKSIKLSNSSRSNTSHGEIVNLMSNDAHRMSTIQVVNNGIFAVPSIIVSLVMLYLSIGWVTFAGLALMLISIPFNSIAAKKLTEIRRDLVGFTDKRVKITNEILQAIKIIKLYAWEGSFAKKVINERDSEIKLLFSFSRYRTLLMVIVVALPTVVSIVVFSTYYGYYKSLDAAKIFSSLAYLNILRMPLGFLPFLVSLIAEMNIAGKRITNFLLLPEMHKDIKKIIDPNLENGVYIKNATLTWNKEKKDESFTLKNIDFQAAGTSLTMVVGSVGSGKSSMVQAMLGEMDVLEGSVGIKGTIAYVPQQAWIINASLRDNILFGKDYDEARYQNVLEVCALKHDIELFPQGDLVEIGERGINLSGGQKQRVSIARAVYSDSDVYILDDPLSAVDAHVGNHLFHKCFKGILSNKTVILVTNQLNYVPQSDYTFVLKDGKIVEHGTYQDLINDQKEFASLLTAYGVVDVENNFESIDTTDINQDKEQTNEQTKEQTKDQTKESKESSKNNNDGNLVSQEEREEGTVSMWVYWKYITVGGGILFFFTSVFFLLEAASKILVDWWLAYWQNQTTLSEPIDNNHYLLIYISLGVGTVIISVIRNYMFFDYTVYASQVLHHQLFDELLKKPMSFFDTTPLGRIINRFTKDLDDIDHMISTSISVFLLILLSVFATLIMISIIIPYLLIPLVPICIIFYVLQYFYRFTSRELQRLESISRSPIFSHFSETLGGVVSIRAYRKENDNILTNQHLLDNNNKCSLTLFAMYQWLGVRLDLLTSLVTFFTCLFITIKRDSISPANVGLSLSYALSLTGNLNRAALQAADTEAKMNSVERIIQYIKGPVEALQIVEKHRPSPDWPAHGAITFDNLVMSYREGLDPVLKGISCEIKAKEKIGICGRTGAGKSSIVLALFRLIEASEGAILIDGKNIANIGLKDLRRNLAIIPQDPVLFSGTLRENLDPFNESTDDELWDILEDIELNNLIKTMEDGLFTKVLENGENFSVGQRQLICLGRALLRKPKILVLDEATASVDGHSDSLIQTTIRTKFSNCTILTIAHRLNTIMDSDRIMVLDAGRISEFDEPWALLQNPSGLLTWLVEETGPQNATFLKMLAQTKKEQKKT